MRLRNSNEEFTLIYKQYREEIYKYCYIKLKPNEQTAEDCMQNAFMALYQKLSKGVEVAQPRAFLYKAASNYVLKAYRENEKLNSHTIPLEECERSTCDTRYKIDSDIDYALLSKKLQSALTEEEQELFKLKFIDDLTISQIKDILNISSEAAAKRVQRMRNKIINSVKAE